MNTYALEQIVKTYLEFKKSKVIEGDEAQEKEFKNVEGIMEGVQAYFDRALGSILLYRMERKQYQDVKAKHEDTPASELYGAEHLVRLFGACYCFYNDLPAHLTAFCAVGSAITCPAGLDYAAGARDLADPVAAQRLSQVHAEELGLVVRLRVPARLGAILQLDRTMSPPVYPQRMHACTNSPPSVFPDAHQIF